MTGTSRVVTFPRRFETDARVHGASVVWEATAPNTLRYERKAGGRGAAAELKVLQRTVEVCHPRKVTPRA